MGGRTRLRLFSLGIIMSLTLIYENTKYEKIRPYIKVCRDEILKKCYQNFVRLPVSFLLILTSEQKLDKIDEENVEIRSLFRVNGQIIP